METPPEEAATLRRLAIAYLVQQFPPEVGAGPARVTEMAGRWQVAGADVVIVTGMPARSIPGRKYGQGDSGYRRRLFMTERWDGLLVLRSWLYRTSRPGLLSTLANNITFMITSAIHGAWRLRGTDVLIASSPPLFPHIAGVVVAWARRIPLVLEVRDLWPDYIVGMGILRKGILTDTLFALEGWLLSRADHIVVVTESFARRLEAKGVHPQRIDVISNGVDTELYFPAEEQPPFPSPATSKDSAVVGYLGNFGLGQGLGAVIEAARMMQDSRPTVRFVLAGDGPEKERITTYCRELGAVNVTLLGPIPKGQTRAFYNACTVCVVPLASFPILQETVPSKIFEVMACARPLVAALGGEGARIVCESGGGIVAPPEDATAIFEAITRTLDLPESDRDRMGMNGRAFVAEHYSRPVLAARYLSLLTRTAAAKSHR